MDVVSNSEHERGCHAVSWVVATRKACASLYAFDSSSVYRFCWTARSEFRPAC